MQLSSRCIILFQKLNYSHSFQCTRANNLQKKARNSVDVELQFSRDVEWSPYLDYALPLSVLQSSGHYKSAFLEYNVQTYFPPQLLGSGGNDKFLMRPSLFSYEWRELGFLEVLSLGKVATDASSSQCLIHKMEGWISDGYYVECRLNEYFLSCRPAHYKKRNLFHINLVTGFNDAQSVFRVAGFGTAYENSEASYSEICDSLWRLADAGNLTDPVNLELRGEVWLWRVREATSNRRSSVGQSLRFQLESYLSGKALNGLEVSVRLEQGEFLARPPPSGFWGSSGAKAWDWYIDARVNQSGAIDLRGTKTLWEHKAIMIQRLNWLIVRGCPIRGSILEKLRLLECAARRIHLMCCLYNKSRSLKCGKAIIPAIRSLYQEETDAFEMLLQAIDSKIDF